MADTDGFGMVIYNASTSKFCRIDSDTMKPTGLGYFVGSQFYPLQDGISFMTIVQNKGISPDKRYFLSDLNYCFYSHIFFIVITFMYS